jgi:hypothetical protein
LPVKLPKALSAEYSPDGKIFEKCNAKVDAFLRRISLVRITGSWGVGRIVALR